MTDHGVATHFRGVVVTLEQTGEAWPADAARIDDGKIFVTISAAIPLPRPSATFTVTAIDGGGRTRVFRSLVLARAESRPPKEYVFD